MTDNQLFDYFRKNVDVFNENPSENLWTAINQNLNRNSFKSPKTNILKKITLSTTAIIFTAILIFYVINKGRNSIENTVDIKTKSDSILTISEVEPTQKIEDTTKKKKNYKRINVINMAKIPVAQPFIPIIEIKPTAINPSKINVNDSLKYVPKILANRYFFETFQSLSSEDFAIYIDEILERNKKNYGKLIIIKAKGQKPFRKIIPKMDYEPKATNINNLKKAFIPYKRIKLSKDSTLVEHDSVK